MQFIVLTDIFGENAWTQSLQQSLNAVGKNKNVTVISPYNKPMAFEGEKEAYQVFVESGGIEAYLKKVETLLANCETQENKVVLGFSAGGAVAWLLAAAAKRYGLAHVLAFYPGQIRHHLDAVPLCNVDLLFPESEAHFDLTPVIEKLTNKTNTRCWQNDLAHGYINPESDNYYQSASQQMTRWLSEFAKGNAINLNKEQIAELERFGYVQL